jgi:RNA polymerase sigma-70 factor (ECF subfamily)
VASQWDTIVREYSAVVYKLAYRLTGDPYDAEDLTQETFIRVFRSLDSFVPGSFEGWIRRITTNLFLDSVRRASRWRMEALGDDASSLPDTGAGPEELVEARHVDPDVHRALAGLPNDYRTALIMCDIEGRSYAEIAESLGVKLGTVRSRIHRARARLRLELTHLRPRGAPSLAAPAL